MIYIYIYIYISYIRNCKMSTMCNCASFPLEAGFN